MKYTPRFDPENPGTVATEVLARVSPYGVDRPLEPYHHYDSETTLAVNVALAAERPLLLSGPAGSGKTTLARSVARCLGWEYVEEVATSRTRAQDLQWRFDALRRLRDAQVPGAKIEDLGPYIEPGLLWWGFAPELAYARRTNSTEGAAEDDLRSIHGIVVLLDEIDKAEPDVPNDLLVPLGANRFVVEESYETVQRRFRPLIFITTNGERDLPRAFVRRCITRRLESPKSDHLKVIGRLHFPDIDDKLLNQVLELFDELCIKAAAQRVRVPSTAEFVDALQACKKLGGSRDTVTKIVQAALWKQVGERG